MRLALYFGRRRQGKTTLALHHALGIAGGIAVYDINRQLARFPESTTSDLGVFGSLVCASGHRVLVYQPVGSVPEEFALFSEALWTRRNFTLVIDEASQLQTASACHPWVDRFIRMAPDGVRVLQTMHRPRDSATICRGLATDWFIFRTTLPRDLEVIAEHCGEEAAERVAGFEEGSHSFYHWDDALGRGEIVEDGSAWREVL